MQSGTVLLYWPLAESAARDELQQFSELKSKAEKEDYLFEQLDFRKDTITGKLLVKTNKRSFRIEHAVPIADWLLFSAAAGQFAVSTTSGGVDIHDLDGTNLRRQFKFPNSIAYKNFSPDGKRLFVLTHDQTAYVLDLTIPETTTASSQP